MPDPKKVWVEILREAILYPPGGWRLCLQWCFYHGEVDDYGYRFIWRRPDGSLAPQRGQARIPSKQESDQLWTIAEKEGWGHLSDQDPTGANTLKFVA